MNIYSVSVDSKPRSYLFTSATIRIPVYTAAIRYVTLHFRDQCGTTFVLQINVYKSFNEHCWKEYKTITHRSMGRVIKKLPNSTMKNQS